MQKTTDECAISTPVTAEQIINSILILDEPENIRESLHEMFLAFFMYHEISPLKERVYCTYTTLYHALQQMETLNAGKERS